MPEQPASSPPAAQRWVWAWNLVVLVPVLPLLWGARIPIQHDIFISDLLHSQLPYKAFLGRTLAEGHLPLWMPDVFSGIPFLASIEAGPLFPPHALLYGLLDPYTALGVSLCLELVVAALGAWCLARRAAAGPYPALIAGIAYAWSGFMVTHVRHLNMHASAAILPWMMVTLERLLASRGRRGGAPLAVSLGLMVLAGHPQILYIACLLMGLRLLFHLGRRDWKTAWRDRLREVLSFSVACGLGLALGAAQLLPTWAYTQQSLGQVKPTWAYASAFACPPWDLLALIWPPLVGAMETLDYASQQVSTIAWGNYGYGGLITLTLAFAAFALGPRRRPVWFWAAGLVLSLLLVLGPHTPLYRAAWELLPGMKLFRFPTRFLVVTGLALAILGALGLETILARVGPQLGARKALWLSLMVALLGLLDLQHHQIPRLPTDSTRAWREAGTPPGIYPDGPTGQRVLVLQEFEIWESAFRQARGHTQSPEPYRAAWTLPLGSSGVLTGLHSASGYARMVHWRSAAQWQEYNRDILPQRARPGRPTVDDPRVSDAFQAQLDRGGVRWLLSPFALEGGRLERRDKDVLLLYRNASALPRAYVTPHWEAAEDYTAAMAWLMGDGAKRSAVPVVEGAAASSGSAAGALTPVEIEEDGPNRISMSIPPGLGGGMLVISDTWDEGWHAWIDGAPADILVANGCQRALRLPSRATRVELRYQPPGWLPGLWTSLAALTVLLCWAGVTYRRRSADSGGVQGSRGARTT